MAKNKKFSTGDYIALGVLALGEVCKTVADSPVTVFVPRGTNIGFSNPSAASGYAEKYLSAQMTYTSPAAYVVKEERSTDLLNQTTVVRNYSDGSVEVIKTDLFGRTTSTKTGGYSGIVTTPTIVPIDKIENIRPSKLANGRVYHTLSEWERGW